MTEIRTITNDHNQWPGSWKKGPGLAAACAMLAMLVFGGWQSLTVERNFQGNWTALFCTGSFRPVPPDLVKGTWIFEGSGGYDGQMYRYIAHDPWLGGIDHNYLDDFSLRERRILVPALAWLLAFGHAGSVDFAYIAVLWGFVFLGSYWACRWAQSHGYSPAWGFLYLLVPSTLVAADRCTIDVATSSLTIALILYSRVRGNFRFFVAAAAMCLTRETGLVILAAVVVSLACNRRQRSTLLMVTAAVPAVAWDYFVFLHSRTTVGSIAPAWLGKGSLFGILIRLLHPRRYALPRSFGEVAQALDGLALIGMCLAFILAVMYWKDNRSGASQLIGLASVFLLLLVSAPQFWDDAYGYSRPFSPLLISVALSGAEFRRHTWLGLLPIALVLPRLLCQLGPQFAGIFGIHII